jgi:NADH dehydrogenase (ubiquinone) 1 beta subcomplex subunit 8
MMMEKQISDDSISAKQRFSISQMLFGFCAVMGFLAGSYIWLEDKKMFRPVLPKQYPSDGKTHYSFDPK